MSCICHVNIQVLFFFNSGSLHLELNHLKEAEKVFKELLRRNPENKWYYQELEKSLQLGKLFVVDAICISHYKMCDVLSDVLIPKIKIWLHLIDSILE